MRVAAVCVLSLLAFAATAAWAMEVEAEADAEMELQVEGVADAEAGDATVEVATNHVERRPTRGYVHAEMMERLPTAEELAEHRHVNAHALDSALDAEGGALGGLPDSNGVMTTYSVESDALHGNGNVVHAHFSSQALLTEADQQEMDERNAEATTFTPERLGGDGTHSATSETSYLEVDGVQLLTETERMAMAETASHVHAGAAARAGPRKYLVHSGMTNTGAVLARYEKQTALSCQERCEADSQCVGFTVARNPKKLNGICTLRSSWSSNAENANFDSFQGHDFSVQPMPFQQLMVYPKTTVAGQQLLIIADVARVRTKRVQRAVELVASVDSNVPDAFWTNIPSNYPGVESFYGVSFAGITSPLDRTGDHTVSVQYSRAFATPIQGDSKGACQQQRLTAIPFPIELSATRVYDVVGQHWNVAASASLTAQNYAAIPGGVPEGETGAMQIKLAVPEDGARLLVFADINRVQHSNGWTNSVFRITVDGQEIAYTNTGEHYGYQYRAVSLRAASGALKRGEHTIAVQAKTQHGRVYFLSDGNGFQQRRLTALMVPKGNLWNRKWNLGTAWLKPSKWADLPGAPMKLTFTTAAAGYLLINAGISRVQSWGNSNVELRLVISSEGNGSGSGDDASEGQEIARTNTGNVNGWRFRDVAFHGTSALVGPGTHSVRVQVRSTSGSTVVFYNDGNGYQQRRLSAVLIPASAGMKSVTHSGVTCTRNKKPTLPPAPPSKPPVPVIPTAKPATPAAPGAPATPAAPAAPAAPAVPAVPAAPVAPAPPAAPAVPKAY